LEELLQAIGLGVDYAALVDGLTLLVADADMLFQISGRSRYLLRDSNQPHSHPIDPSAWPDQAHREEEFI
jgi:hypothetical protein